MSYYLAPSLKQLRDEIDAAHPGRDKSSDGWIGDAAHNARKSDHNPDWDSRGVVRAIDVDISDIDVNKLMAVLKNDSRVNYFIYNWSIYGASSFAKRRYTGSNGHTKHIHVSIKHSGAAERAGAWGYSGGTVKPVGNKPKPAPKPASTRPTDYAQLATDGKFGEQSVEAAQILMSQIGLYERAIDGELGEYTWKALQEWLTGLGHYGRAIDGKPGYYTYLALQQFLRKKGLYPASKFLLDGKFGPATITAFQKYLNTQRG